MYNLTILGLISIPAIFLDNLDEEVYSETIAMFNDTMAEMVTSHNITGLTPFELFHKGNMLLSASLLQLSSSLTD